MQRALRLAEQAMFTTDPNPRVGCVIVAGDEVVGEGYTSPAGGPHAEIHALNAAGSRARGATAYVTLEPCSHHGRTPPCADALIEAGIGRVVAALRDPNPQVDGGGMARLASAGIATEIGEGAEQAVAQNVGFVARMTRGTPWVRVKMAASVDGRSAMASGESQWITAEAARADVHRWRARSSAIVTGSGTVNRDDPLMTARIDCPVKQPLRVVMSRDLDVVSSARILRSDAMAKTIVATAPQCPTTDPQRIAARREMQSRLSQQQVDVVELHGDDAGVSPLAVVEHLAQLAVNEVWVEAGPRLGGSFLQSGCVDELIVYLGAKLLGNETLPMLCLSGITQLSDALPLTDPQVRILGDDIRLRYRMKPALAGS